jgi:hypothetical protein
MTRCLVSTAIVLVTVVSASASPIHVIEGTVTKVSGSGNEFNPPPSALANVGDHFVLRYHWEPFLYQHPIFPPEWARLYYELTFETGWTVWPEGGSTIFGGLYGDESPVQAGGQLLSDNVAEGSNPDVLFVDHWYISLISKKLFLETDPFMGPTIEGRVDNHFVLPEAPLFLLMATGLGLLAVFRLSRSPSIGLARSHRGAP